MSPRSSDEIIRQLKSNTTTTTTTTTTVPPSLSISTNSQLPPSSNSTTLDPLLSLPITPDALLRHVRQMRIASRSRNRSPTSSSPHQSAPAPSISIHSRATSNASSTYEDLISSNLAHSSSTISNASHPPSIDLLSSSNTHSLTLTIPESHLDLSRTLTETLDLSHQRIADLTLPVVEELAEYVERLALGYNYLPVLPDHFSILGKSLRYLNLRGNHMEVFPEVLTRMPSLEILDVSRNKIKAFPRRPGSLDCLRVLSVSRNRIKRLPNYIANLTVLRVLKIDHNPVVWPPKELSTFIDATDKLDEDDVDPAMRFREDSSTHIRTRTPSNETTTTMVQWLRTLQEWMRKNPYVRPVKQTRPSTGETIGDPSDFGPSRSTEFEQSFNSFKVANSPDASPMMTFQTGSGLPLPNTNLPLPPPVDHVTQHNRNASSISSSQWARKRPELRLKKSLPDLRRNHAEIMVERSADVESPYFSLSHSSRMLPPNSGTSIVFSPNSPSTTDRGPRSAMALSNKTLTNMIGQATNHSPPGQVVSFEQNEFRRTGGTQIRRLKIGASGDDDTLAGVRNSGAYFRRLSMLPASTISKQVPLPLLQLMDGIRGILFSLSQIYAALKQFVIFASQDRLPGALSRMTSAADDSMSKLINALDRFDSSTRRAQPGVEIVQQVLQSCRDNVIVFGKLVNVLSIQLKVLTGAADVRYSRTLLLSLYGATAEIAMSWQTLTPLVDDVISLPSLKKSKPSSQEEPKDDAEFPQETIITSTSDLQQPLSKATIQEDQHTLSESINQLSDPTKAVPNTAGQTPSALSLGSSTSSKARQRAGSSIAEDAQLSTSISPASAGLATNLPPTPTLATATYNSFPLPLTPKDLNGLSVMGSKIESSSTSFPTNVSRLATGSRNMTNRLNNSGDSLNTSLHLMTEHIKQATTSDSLPMMASPIGLPRSPAFASIASLAANSSFPSDTNLSSSTDSIAHPKELLNERGVSIPPLPVNNNNWASRSTDSPLRLTHSPVRSALPTSTMMVDIPERTTSRNYHHATRFDSSLTRTDQDFLDMAEATIEIAVSVTSMMLENLGQATLVEQTSTNHGAQSHSHRNDTTSGGSHSSRRDHRKATITTSLTKAGELKELCEVEIEVIRRLRVSLSNFWVARKVAASAVAGTVTQHPARDGSCSSISSTASSLSSSTTTTNDCHATPTLGTSSSASLAVNSQLGPHDHLAAGLTTGIEAKKVFEDATAFVRAVIQTANLARATMTEYPLTKGIREGLGELTTATKELATLLAVSSFKPGAGTAGHHLAVSSPSNPIFPASGLLPPSGLNGHLHSSNPNHYSPSMAIAPHAAGMSNTISQHSE